MLVALLVISSIFKTKLEKKRNLQKAYQTRNICTKSQTTDGLKTLIRNKGVFHGIGKGIVLLRLRFEEPRCFQN